MGRWTLYKRFKRWVGWMKHCLSQWQLGAMSVNMVYYNLQKLEARMREALATRWVKSEIPEDIREDIYALHGYVLWVLEQRKDFMVYFYELVMKMVEIRDRWAHKNHAPGHGVNKTGVSRG